MSDQQNEARLLAVDLDDCPKTDNPVVKYDCKGCEYYQGFEMWNGKPCIYCNG